MTADLEFYLGSPNPGSSAAVHVIHTIPETPGRWERPAPVEGIAELPAHRPGAEVAVPWVWTRGDGIWWCQDCRCRVLYGHCTNVRCHNARR